MTKQTFDIIWYVCLSDQSARDRAYGRVVVVERSARDAFCPLNRHRRDCPPHAADFSLIESAVPGLSKPRALFALARTCAHIAGTGARWVG